MGTQKFQEIFGGRGTATISGATEAPGAQARKEEDSFRYPETEGGDAAEKLINERYRVSELLRIADEAIAAPPPRSAEEIDEKAAKLESLEKRFEQLPQINQSRFERLERIEKRGMPGLSASDYEMLEQRHVGVNLLNEHKKVQDKLSKLQKEKEKRQDSSLSDIIERLTTAESGIREEIERIMLDATEGQWKRRIAAVRSKIDEHYENRAAKLEGIIEELRADPEVMKRHGERVTERLENAREEGLTTHRAVLAEATPLAQLLSEQQSAVLKRVEEIAGADALKDPQETSRALIAAVLEGQGAKQIKNPEEVVPWKRMYTQRYFDVLNFLLNSGTRASLKKLAEAGDETAQTTLRRLETVVKTHDKLKDMASGEFWSAFDKRVQKDNAQEAKRREDARKQQEEQVEEQVRELEKELLPIIERGGFRVNVPGDAVREARKEGGGGLGAVRLEAKKSKKGNVYLEVVEVAGSAAKVLNNRSVSLAHAYGATVNAPQFPQWLQKHITNNPELAKKIEELRWQR